MLKRLAMRYRKEDLPAELAGAEPRVALAYARFADQRRKVYRDETTETLEHYRDRLEAFNFATPDGRISRELAEIHDDLRRRMVWNTNSELAFFGLWTPYYPPPSMLRLGRDVLGALSNEKLLRARDREDLVRARLAKRAAKELRVMAKHEVVEDRFVQDLLNKEIGRRWFQTNCASDLGLARKALRIAYPGRSFVLFVGDPPSEN